MNYYDAIMASALDAVMRETPDYVVRRIQRWYSAKFATPLMQVADIPFEVVLQHFYEEQYADLEPDDREKERIRLTESDEERAKRIAKEDEQSFEEHEFVKLQEALEMDRRNREGSAPKVETPKIPTGALPEAKLVTPSVAPIPEGITMKFMDEESFEDLLEGSGLTPPSKG
jgi:hypothetical protein